MRKIQFTIDIEASRQQVWDALWNHDHYREWTAVFYPGSYYESDLQPGSEIRFLSPGENGMYGVVEDVVPLHHAHFRHLGEVLAGEKQEAIYGEEAIEHYDLTEDNGRVSLTATLNITDEYLAHFSEIFPRALQKVKEIAEQ